MKKIFAVILMILLAGVAPVRADDRNWNSGGDESDWFDKDNWMEQLAPTSADDAVVDQSGASVTIAQDFSVKSITLGSKRSSVLNLNNFVTGEVKPSDTDETAFSNGRKGHIILKGTAGKITLKGSYVDSEEVLPEEPTFMFYAQ